MMRPKWPFEVKLVVSLLFLAFFIYLLFRFSAIIAPLVLAFILAFVLSPLVSSFQTYLHMPRLAAMGVVYLLVVVILSLIPIIFLPTLLAEMRGINFDVMLILRDLKEFISQPLQMAGLPVDLSDLLNQTLNSAQGLVETFASQTVELLVKVISSIIWLIFIVIVSFYLIKDGEKFRLWFDNLVPTAYLDDFITLRQQINQIWVSFFRGQLILGIVVSILFICVGFILGLPFAFGMGVLAGLLEFLPSVGHGIWLAIAASLAFISGSTWIPVPHWVFALILICLHLVYQQFDLNYLIPRIIGRSVHLHPLVVILGIVSGALVAGLLGIPLAAPTIASGRLIFRYFYRNILDLEPFPQQEDFPLLPRKEHWWQSK